MGGGLGATSLASLNMWQILLIILFMCPLDFCQNYFDKINPLTKTFTESNYRFYYDNNLSLETSIILFDHFHQNQNNERIISFYLLPNSDFYLVSTYDIRNSIDEGYRLYFVKIINNKVKEFFHSKGIIGCWFLRPVFFKYDDTIVIVADYGEEHPEGFQVIEYSNDSFKELGCVELAIFKEDGDYEDASSQVKIRIKETTLYFDFFEDIVLYPLTKKEIILKKQNHAPITFTYIGKSFIKVN